GLNLGTAREGGYEKMRADQVKKRRERAQNLEVGEDEGLKQELNKVEQDLQTLRAVGSHEIAEIDKKIEGAIKANKAAQSTLNANPSDPTAQNKAITAANRVNDLRQQRGSIKNASGTPQNKADLQSDLTNRQSITQTARATGATPAEIAQFERDEESIRVALGVADAAHDLGIANGRGDKSINEYEDTLIPEARHDVEAESRTRKRAYAEREEKWNRFWTGGKFNKTDIGRRTVREAGHNIRMEAKIEESGKGGGH
ncbi:MAG TPA: hypothetical protein VK675_04925, partial [Candidatus Paceibacterota bacterium]|nr:hypothetical protein [Candidatus Paceibacterota bacterium]